MTRARRAGAQAQEHLAALPAKRLQLEEQEAALRRRTSSLDGRAQVSAMPSILAAHLRPMTLSLPPAVPGPRAVCLRCGQRAHPPRLDVHVLEP